MTVCAAAASFMPLKLPFKWFDTWLYEIMINDYLYNVRCARQNIKSFQIQFLTCDFLHIHVH